jgi:hypothetical protein
VYAREGTQRSVESYADALKQRVLNNVGREGFQRLDVLGRGWAALNRAELAAIHLYIGSEGAEIAKQSIANPLSMANDRMIRADRGDGTIVRLGREFAQVLDSALSKLPQPAGTYYRMEVKLSRAEFALFEPGKTVEFSRPASVSADEPAIEFLSRPTRFVIEGRPSDVRDRNPDERELIFRARTKFRVMSREIAPETVLGARKNITVIRLRQVD